MAYITMRNMGASQASSILAAVFITFGKSFFILIIENGLVW
jgi:hypothetical protein